MATSDLPAVSVEYGGGRQVVFPASPSSQWTEAILARGGGSVAGIEGQDAATIVNPEVSITLNTRRIMKRLGQAGSRLQLRLKYNRAISGSITSPVVCIFGRTGKDAWQKLLTLAGANTCTLTIATGTDDDDGTFKYTSVDPLNEVFDTMGCEEFVVGVLTAFNATGTLTDSVLQAKFV